MLGKLGDMDRYGRGDDNTSGSDRKGDNGIGSDRRSGSGSDREIGNNNAATATAASTAAKRSSSSKREGKEETLGSSNMSWVNFFFAKERVTTIVISMFSTGSPENGRTLIKLAIFLAHRSLLLYGLGGGLDAPVSSDPGKYKYSKSVPIVWCHNQIN